MKQKFTFLIAAVMLLTIICLPWKAWCQTRTTTYRHVFSTKPSTGNNVTLSYVNWNISATNLNGYQSSYAGVQIGKSSASGSITLTSSSNWGTQTGTYYGKTKITEVRLWLNNGSGTITTYTVTIGGKTATASGTIVKNSSASSYMDTSLITYTPANDGDSGAVVINVATSTKAGYICCVEIDCEEPGSGSDTYTVTYNANDGSANPSTFTDNNGGEGYAAGDYTVLSSSNSNFNFTNVGHNFARWDTENNGHGTPYEPGDEIDLDGNVTLYAIWAKNKYNVAVSSIDNVTLSATYGTNSSIAEGGNPDIDYDTEITLSATGLAPGKAFVWDVYKKDDTSTKVPVTNNKFNVPAYDVIISGEIVDMTYNITYTSNVTLSTDGGTSASTCKVVISNVDYDGIKAGTGSAAGAWKVTVPVNTTKLHLHLAAWNGESVTLSVSPDGYSDNISLTANTGISGSGTTYTWGTGNSNQDPSSNYHYKVITFADPLEEAVTLTFSASSGNRFVVWGVNAEASTNPYITADDVEIDDDATSGSITYMVHNVPEPEGTLTAAIKTGDWLTLGDIEENVPFTCEANPNAVERTATVTLTYSYGDDETTSLDVTVTQAPKVVTYTYTLATSIESGKHYIITDGNTMVMNSQADNYRNAVDVTDNDYYDNEKNEFSIPSNASICEFVINGPDADGYYTIHETNANTGYLYAASSSKNYLRTQSFNDNNGRWRIRIGDAGDTIVAQGTYTNKYMRYNSGGWFSCYSSGSSVSALPYLYVRDDTNYEFYMDIAKYTTPSTGDPVNGWNFIALPLASAYTLSGSNLVAGTYDLYRLNNTTWENYKNNEHSDFTTLNNGTGYLYANSANVTLHFSGAINTFTTEENANQKVYSEGWNLIGNPYNIPVYINKPYYTLNAARNAVVATAVKNVAIAPCTGVIADGGTIIFTEASQNVQAINNGNIQMVLAHNVNVRGDKRVETIDNAIVSFNEGSQLEKFYFGNPSASIFIPQNGEDYAIAFSDRQGDVPLYFKANETGTYTISFAGDEMSLNGIYLIDILAEEEIDLSVNPSYTFIGSPVDRMARFKIVFRNTGDDGTSDIFAYQNGNDIIVSGEGELQIFDVMGRMVSRQYVSGVEAINILTQGVYIMKLNDKTQKIVVR